MLITFEGIDFCGKSVQIEQLINRLQQHQIPYILLREPGGTIIAEKIREVLLTRETEAMSPITEYLLYSAARAQLVRQQIEPALARGWLVICDRFADSSTAYQGYGRGIDLKLVQQINAFATNGIVPQLTFLIDIDLEEMERRKKQGRKLDRMENEERSFFERVRQGFLKMAAQEAERFYLIDGKRAIHSIADEVWTQVQQRWMRFNQMSSAVDHKF
ncbi:MAG: dTMP kinase [candidate division KSB1 bacterium]|nr:dTMP kinase [candidate division KSB1 bacterium]